MTGHTEASRPFSEDRMKMLPLHTVADAALLVLHPMQEMSPEEQVAGAAVLFATVCKRVGVSGQGMWDFAERVLNAPIKAETRQGQNTLMALRDFAGLRIAGDDGVSIG